MPSLYQLGATLLTEGGQAGAEAAVNDLLYRIEAHAVGLPAEGIENTPSVSTDGTIYIVGSSPSGDFSTFTAGDVAVRINSGWVNWSPSEGWFASLKDTDTIARFSGSVWEPIYDDVAFTSVASPGSSEDVTLFFTEHAITIEEMNAVLRGSSTPSVTWTIRHDSDRSATGNEVVTSGTTTTSTTNGSSVTSFNDATIPAGSWVWLETTAQSGTVDELGLSIRYTRDIA